MNGSSRRLLLVLWSFMLLTGFHHHHHFGSSAGGSAGCGGTPEHHDSPTVSTPVSWTLSGEIDATASGAVANVTVTESPSGKPVTDAVVRVNGAQLTQAEPGSFVGPVQVSAGALVEIDAVGAHPVTLVGPQPIPPHLAITGDSLAVRLGGPLDRGSVVETDTLGDVSTQALDIEDDSTVTVALAPMFHRASVQVIVANDARSSRWQDGSVALVDNTASLTGLDAAAR